jgi:hypothetical protein
VSVDSSFFPPQPVITKANTPIASEYIPNLLFFTKNFLLLKNSADPEASGAKTP